MRSLLPLVLLVLVPGLATGGGEDALPATAPAPEVLVDQAFARRYADTAAEVEIRMFDPAGNRMGRRLYILTKDVGGRMHSIARLLKPPYLRGMGVLNIETGSGGEDSFVFMPALGRVRRISTAQRSDAFLGSDLTYEDFERLRAGDFDFLSLERVALDGEPVFRVMARPRQAASYGRVEFAIAASDRAILSSRYFRDGADAPYRTMDAPRAGQVRSDGHVVPSRLVVRNLARGTRTEVLFHELRISPEIDERIFSAATLEKQTPLPRFEP